MDDFLDIYNGDSMSEDDKAEFLEDFLNFVLSLNDTLRYNRIETILI